MTALARSSPRLYELLPALYRIADERHGGQLRELLRLITAEADQLYGDTQQLWDDFFIETAQKQLIPYIAELVGNTPLHELDLTSAAATANQLFRDLTGRDLQPTGAIRTRADVANTIWYRRRKGTPAMLEQLATDVTGWGTHVVEFFTQLDWSQHLEHLRLDRASTPDLRRVDVGDRVGGPWDREAHTVDVRPINEWDGWHNIPNLGFFLWRLESVPLTEVKPRPIGGDGSWRMTFSPLGNDLPLFSSGQVSTSAPLSTELGIEMPIRAAAFFEDLRSGRPSNYYADTLATGSLMVVVAGLNGERVPARDVRCGNLERWESMAQPSGTAIWVDVTRGRLLVPTGRTGQPLRVSYYYGFSAPLGGGEYERANWIVPSSSTPVTGGGSFLAAAIAGRPPGGSNVLQVDDSESYELSAPITLAAGESLTIQALNGRRPHIRLTGGETQPANTLAITSTGPGASLTLSGLLVEGGINIEGDLKTLRVLHTTLVPGRSVVAEASRVSTGASVTVFNRAKAVAVNRSLEVQIAFSITGALRLPAEITKVWLLDSIVDGIETDGAAPTVAISADGRSSGPPAHIERSTILGEARLLKLDLGSESIFTGRLSVDQTQQGCVRFCYLPPKSRTPQRYRCQPELAVALEQEQRQTEAARSGAHLPSGWKASIEHHIWRWLVPSFVSTQYGHPAFAQLRGTSPAQIRTGAEDGSEMGAFCMLKQPQRESNLRIRLEEYLPVGLEAGIVYVT